jgi:hypothetical protein
MPDTQTPDTQIITEIALQIGIFFGINLQTGLKPEFARDCFCMGLISDPVDMIWPLFTVGLVCNPGLNKGLIKGHKG